MDIPRHWRLRKERYKLQGGNCSSCGKKVFPPRPFCVECTWGSLENKEVLETLQIPELDKIIAQAVCAYM